MPIIYTSGYKIPLQAGKSLGQIEAEKERYVRGVENARVAVQQQQVAEARIERQLATRWQQQQAIIEQQRYEKEEAREAEEFGIKQVRGISEFGQEQRLKEEKFAWQKIQEAAETERKKTEVEQKDTEGKIVQRLYETGQISLDEYKEYLGARIEPPSDLLKVVPPGYETYYTPTGKVGIRETKEPKEYKPNAATQKALAALSAYKSQKEALAAIERNRDAMELSGVDIDYVESEAKRILPEEFDEATWFEKMKGTQKYPRRKKNGVWYEKREDNLWHKIGAPK